MFDKLKKHGILFIRRMNQSREVNRMKKCPNKTIQIICESFETVRSESFEQEDLAVFERCESYRNELKGRDEKISFHVFGSDKEQTVSEICRKASSPEIWCRFLYLLTKKVTPKNILEIGTNLGVSGSYLLEAIAGNIDGKLTTMEGVSQLCDISSRQFSKIVSRDKFNIEEGLYQDTFPEILKKNILFELHFIDGNHQQDATLDYFFKLKEKTQQQSIFIFDDINWSKGMKTAWKTIQNDESVLFSIDLWKQGIVIINPLVNEKKSHFKLFLSY